VSDVTRILSAIGQGQPQAAAQLLPLVYDELRRMAARQMAQERPGHTLDATGLVHEAYLRLVGGSNRGHWDHRRQFLSAAAEAMRRILVDHARKRTAEKHGGRRERVDLADVPQRATEDATDWLMVDDTLAGLERQDPGAAELVRLKLFAGLSVEEAADLLGISRASAYRDWAFARAWMRQAAGVGQ
jgi:RNA polymerase sigma factor (TIGR02999 family)